MGLTLGDLIDLGLPRDTPIVLNSGEGVWEYATADHAAVIEAHPNTGTGPEMPEAVVWMDTDTYQERSVHESVRKARAYAGPKRHVVWIALPP